MASIEFLRFVYKADYWTELFLPLPSISRLSLSSCCSCCYHASGRSSERQGQGDKTNPRYGYSLLTDLINTHPGSAPFHRRISLCRMPSVCVLSVLKILRILSSYSLKLKCDKGLPCSRYAHSRLWPLHSVANTTAQLQATWMLRDLPQWSVEHWPGHSVRCQSLFVCYCLRGSDGRIRFVLADTEQASILT